MLRKIYELGARLPSIVITIFSFLEIFYGINWIGQLNNVPFLEQIHPWILGHTFQIIVITFIIYLVCKIVLFVMDRKEDTDSSDRLHFFFHELRDEMLVLLSQDVNAYRNSPLGLESFYRHVTRSSELLCGHASNFLKSYTHKNFNVYIKLLKPSSSKSSTAKDDIEIMTLCRAGINKTIRSQGDFKEKIRLIDNTDFEMIFDSEDDEDSNVFAIANLPFYIFQRLLSGTRYKTSTKHPLKKYWSTVVAPIRIHTAHLPKERRTEATYTVIGFLCVDYRYILRRNEIKRIKNYVKCMGDALYPFFDNVMLIDAAIRQKGQVATNALASPGRGKRNNSNQSKNTNSKKKRKKSNKH